MHLQNGDAALSGCGAPEEHRLAGSIVPENMPTARDLQVAKLSRHFVLSTPLAMLLAESIFGVAHHD